MTEEVKPSVRQCLEIAQELGIPTLIGAVEDYFRHSNIYFCLEDTAGQRERFFDELEKYDLMRLIDHRKIEDLSVKEALERLDEKQRSEGD